MTGKTISHYKILEKIGEGGMGVVYLAEDQKLARKVAVKALPPSVAAKKNDRERFIIEAKAAAALNHSNIATIHAIEEDNGELFIVMEYIEGNELRNIVGAHHDTPLQINDILNYTIQICHGLNAAHNKGIIHRDIKSSNIMVTGDGRVKIMDFGLAKIGDGKDLTKDHSTVGTLAYMAPEQIHGHPADKRADIFSFGVVLYEMVTGKLPFDGDYEAAIMYSIINEEPASAKTIRSDCPISLSGIINKCLEKDAKDRFQSMDEILAALEDDTFKSVRKDGSSEKHNLPVQLTSFIGREREIDTVKNLLTENRLVTLTGAGGCGKSRLAQQAARDIVSNYDDGVWLVELTPLSDEKNIPQAIASALNIKEEANTPLEETIEKDIKEKQLLIILDNCEHLLSACSQITERFLKSSTGLSILATSREVLNLAGEYAWTVPSLSLPVRDVKYSLDQLTEYESIQLFQERASAISSNFKLSEQNAEAIAGICTRLDGIPLAIELAVSRIKLISPQKILERLDNRFQLLTSGQSTLERHKTLRATIDWSYDLLTENERILLNRLSIFAGGCDLEAVEKVCGFEPLDADIIMDCFSSLVDKSLVVTEITKDGSYRYQLLETIRQYGMERLNESGEADKTQESHFEYFLKLTEKGYHTWLEMTAHWIDTLNKEHENIRSALEWSKDRPLEHLRMTGFLHHFWFECNYFYEGLDYLNNALTNHRQEDEETARALTGFLKIETEVFSRPKVQLHEEILNILRKVGNKKELGLGLVEYVLNQCMRDELSDVLEKAEEAVGIFNELQDDYMLLRAETMHGFAYVCLQKPEIAIKIAGKNLETAKKLDAQWDYYFNYHYYADATLLLDDFKNGELRYGVALKAAADSANPVQAAYEMRGVSNCVSGQGRFIKALILSGAFEQFLKDNNLTESSATFWDYLRERHLGNARNALGDDAEKYEEQGRQMGFEKAVEYALDFDKD